MKKRKISVEKFWKEFSIRVIAEFAIRGYNVHPKAVKELHDQLLLWDGYIAWKTDPNAKNGNLEDAIEGICKLKTDGDSIITQKDVLEYFHQRLLKYDPF